MSERKYLPVGSLKQFNNEDGTKGYPFVELDLYNLKELVEYLTAFGKEHLAGVEKDEIAQLVKDKKVPRVQISMFDPNDGAPDFIKKNLAIKLK